MIGSGAEYSHQRYKPLMPESYYAIDQPPANKNIYHMSKHMISRLHMNSNIPNIYNFRVFGLYGPYEDHTRRLISNNIFKFMQSGEMHASANHALITFLSTILFPLFFILLLSKITRTLALITYALTFRSILRHLK